MANAYARKYQDEYPGGVYWLEVDKGAEIPVRDLLQKAGMTPPGEEGFLLQVFCGQLNAIEEPKLVILDNLEDPSLPNRFTLKGNAHLLATTRNAKVDLSKVDMDLPNDDEALDIFLAYADKTVSDQQEEIAQKLCRRCGNLPLALEILGAMAKVHSLESVLEMTAGLLDEEENVRTKNARTTIRQVLALTEREYRHPKAMDVLVHAAYLHSENIHPVLIAEVMEEAGAEVLKALAALAEWSLVKPLDNGCYSCHRLIQEAAREADTDHKTGRKVASVLSDTADNISGTGHYVVGQSLAPHLLRIAELGQSTLPEDVFPQVRHLFLWGNFLHNVGLYSAAEAIKRQVFERLTYEYGPEHPDTLIGMNNLAGTLHARGALAMARDLQKRGFEIQRYVLGEEHPDTLASMDNLASMLRVQGDLSGAQDLQERVLEVCYRTLGAEHPSTLTGMNNLAATLSVLGDLSGARDLQERELEVCRRVLGAEHLNTLTSMSNLALTLQTQGDLSGARDLQERVLEVCCRTLGAEHPSTLTGMNNLTGTLHAQGDLSGARDLHEQVLKMCCRILGEEHPDTLTSMNNLAGMLGGLGNLAGARDLHEQVLGVRCRVLGEEHPDTLTSMNNLAYTLWSLEEYEKAIALMEQAIAGRTKVLGENHPGTKSSQEALASMRKLLKQ